MTLNIQKVNRKSFAKLLQASLALKGCRNYKSCSGDSFLLKILVTKQDNRLGGDISINIFIARILYDWVSGDHVRHNP